MSFSNPVTDLGATIVLEIWSPGSNRWRRGSTPYPNSARSWCDDNLCSPILLPPPMEFCESSCFLDLGSPTLYNCTKLSQLFQLVLYVVTPCIDCLFTRSSQPFPPNYMSGDPDSQIARRQHRNSGLHTVCREVKIRRRRWIYDSWCICGTVLCAYGSCVEEWLRRVYPGRRDKILPIISVGSQIHEIWEVFLGFKCQRQFQVYFWWGTLRWNSYFKEHSFFWQNAANHQGSVFEKISCSLCSEAKCLNERIVFCIWYVLIL